MRSIGIWVGVSLAAAFLATLASILAGPVTGNRSEHHVAARQADSSPTESLSVGSSQGIPVGAFHLPNELFGRPFTGALRALAPDSAHVVLATARSRGVRVIMTLGGSRRHFQNTDQSFSTEAYAKRVQRYDPTDIAAFVADGTLIGAILFDEPQDRSNWGGEAVPAGDIRAAASLARTRFPGVPIGIGAPPSFIVEQGLAETFDFAFAQYAWRKGDFEVWVRTEQQVAEAAGLRVVYSINVLNGGARRGQVSASQLEEWGSLLALQPSACAVLLWRYDRRREEDYFGDQEVQRALGAVIAVAQRRQPVSCDR